MFTFNHTVSFILFIKILQANWISAILIFDQFGADIKQTKAWFIFLTPAKIIEEQD